jgi:predicted lipoprotein with Yx(FWY)xxD motif
MFAFRRIAVLVAAMLVAAACTSAGAGSTPSPSSPLAAAPSAAAPSAAAAVTIGSASSASFGTILTGPTGLTLYTYAADTATASNCTGDCATEWPPLLTSGQAMAGSGLTGQVGTITRADGTTQVTYAGHPLYYWEGDKKAGDVTGNGIDKFAVATAAGSAPMPAASAGTVPASSGSGYKY